MHEETTLLEKMRIPLTTIVAVGATLLTGCGGSSVGRAAPTSTPSAPSEASPFPNADTPHGGMRNAQDPQLRLLAGYEVALHHRFRDEMYFTDMPRTVEEAKTQAADMAQTLKEYSKYGIKPLIIMEPTDNDGGNIALSHLNTHEYATVLDTLFVGLKDQGITEDEMGTLVPVPEADLPKWGTHSTSPKLFGKNYAAIGGAFKRVFPGAHLSLLLDSAAYPNDDVNYEHGDTSTASLMRYIQALRNTSGMPAIDSIGFQGFPWNTTDRPQDYLNSGVAEALARRLGVHDIWFNTGSAESYGGKKVPAAIRHAQLLGTLAQAYAVKVNGFEVQVNVFGGSDPDVQWEYTLQNGTVAAPLPEFVEAAGKEGVDAELFVNGQ